MLPHFEVGFFLPQIFWLLLSLSALYFGVRFFVLPVIEEVLMQRRHGISSDLEVVKGLQVKNQELIEKKEQLIKESDSVVFDLMKDLDRSISRYESSRKDKLARDLKALYLNHENDKEELLKSVLHESADIKKLVLEGVYSSLSL